MHTFHKLLIQELKPYLKKKNPEGTASQLMQVLEDFPPKKVFHNTDRDFIHKRMKKLNLYFSQLFERFPQKVPYTNSLLDMCTPFPLNVAVIGERGSGKSELIINVIQALKSKNFAQRDKSLEQLPPTLTKNKSTREQKEETIEEKKIEERKQSKSPCRVRMVFTKQKSAQETGAGEINISDLKDASPISTDSGHLDLKRSTSQLADHAFPLDVSYHEDTICQNLLFRFSMQECHFSSAGLPAQLDHVLQQSDIHLLVFTYNQRDKLSFNFLKTALKELIFALVRSKRTQIPYIIVGMLPEVAVTQLDTPLIPVSKAIKLHKVLKKHHHLSKLVTMSQEGRFDGVRDVIQGCLTLGAVQIGLARGGGPYDQF